MLLDLLVAFGGTQAPYEVLESHAFKATAVRGCKLGGLPRLAHLDSLSRSRGDRKSYSWSQPRHDHLAHDHDRQGDLTTTPHYS
jgi:hypothetical protein